MADNRSAATATALGVPLGLAAACWIVTVDQMQGMNMGVATQLGSFTSFASQWVPMMAAMMLPAAVPAAVLQARDNRRSSAIPVFVVSYVAVWALVGLVVYALYRPHGTTAAGAVVIATGVYELTPLKRRFRRRCREAFRSGVGFGLCCVGSTIGLMAMLVVLGVMSIVWMSVIAVVVLLQKLLPETALLDAAIAVAIVALGVWIVIAPSAVPGLMPSPTM